MVYQLWIRYWDWTIPRSLHPLSAMSHGSSAVDAWTFSLSQQPSSLSFKGAMAFQPWKRLLLNVPAGHDVFNLQWSHGLLAMDTPRADRPVLPARAASMEPRLFSHGYSDPQTTSRSAMPSFNGAMISPSWILASAPRCPADVMNLQ